MKTVKKKFKKRDPENALCRKRDRALDRVIDVFEKRDDLDSDGEALNKALDALTLAHVAVTFNFISG
jgi:hypothetical protein